MNPFRRENLLAHGWSLVSYDERVAVWAKGERIAVQKRFARRTNCIERMGRTVRDFCTAERRWLRTMWGSVR